MVMQLPAADSRVGSERKLPGATRIGRSRASRAGLGGAAGVVCALLCGAMPAWSGTTKIEGEYEITLDSRKTQRTYEWDYDYNNNDTWTGAQFRVFTVPFPNTEAFLRFEADWNTNNNFRRPVFQYRESHLRYRWDQGTWGADTRLFQRQDRFWVESHLIGLVRTDLLKDGDNAQGIRTDFWAPGNTQVAWVLSDYSGQSNPGAGSQLGIPVGTDDAHVLRVRREFFGDRLRAGMTFLRLNDRQDNDADAGRSNFQEVWATDFRYSFGPDRDFRIEYADSRASGFDQHDEGGFFEEAFSLRRPDRWVPSDGELRAEYRTIRAGTPRTGYYNVIPLVWYIGPGYVNPFENFGANPFGNGGSDEQGFALDTWYLVPARAITLSAYYAARERRFFESRQTRKFYTELYTEYVNGFTSKFSYYDFWDRSRTDRGPVLSETRSLFAEVQVETRLAWMRVQGKLKDFDTEFQKELASLETSVNLTQKLKIYSRFAFGNDPTRLRRGIFSQLQYRPQGNMEVYFEYGPSWIGDSPNPVDDGDLEGSGDQEEMFRFRMKGTF